ncbi:glycosyltransferase family 4 protein [Mycolicibacterium elephantis]
MYSQQVVRAYLRRGIEVVVITQCGPHSGWQTLDYPDGTATLFNTGSGGQLATAVKMLKMVFTVSRRKSFDFFHATTWRPAMTLVAARHSRPIVISAHGREFLVVPKFLRPLMWAVLRRATLVVAVSSATRARASKRLGRIIDISKWLVASNGLSYESNGAPLLPNRDESSGVRFLTLARLVERKNVQGCIAAFRDLKEAGYRNFEYRVGGTGPLAQSLQKQVEDAKLDNHVHLMGYINNDQVPSLYEWADVFLHPQIDLDDGKDFEGFGLSIADAMAFGCLAIAGDGSGPSDFVHDGVTGLLVDGSDQDRLQSTIRSVLDNPVQFKALADAGQTYVQTELSWDKHVGVILDAIQAE